MGSTIGITGIQFQLFPDAGTGLVCYDAESFICRCCDLQYIERDVAKGTVKGCMHRKSTEEEVAFLAGEI